jgi:hypothetical protein
MKKTIILITLVFALVSSLCFLPLSQTSALANPWIGEHSCPVCDLPAHYTGQSKFEYGHSFYLFQCLGGHTWWQRED